MPLSGTQAPRASPIGRAAPCSAPRSLPESAPPSQDPGGSGSLKHAADLRTVGVDATARNAPLACLAGGRGTSGRARRPRRRLRPLPAQRAPLLAAGFQEPQELFEALVTPTLLSIPGAGCYLAELDGEAMTTAVRTRIGESAAIFNVATAPTHQRRGYGAAVTALAVRDAVAEGARWVWLQSSVAATESTSGSASARPSAGAASWPALPRAEARRGPRPESSRPWPAVPQS